MSRIALNDFLARRTTSLVVDVRAPIEYHQAHIPGAVNLPLLDDQQREAVGTAYARQGAEAARILGLQLVGPHLADKCKQLLKLLKSGPPPVEGSSYGKVLLYCWRGGARSSSMAWMFQGFGIDCAVLEGGYKRYRQNVRASFEQPRPVVILGGKTGSAKTLMLRELAALGEAVVDLEGLAHHKGSSFGWVNQPPQPSNEMFENRLFEALLPIASHQRLWLEDESRNIGSVYLPDSVWVQMRQAPVMFLDIEQAVRVPFLVKDYGDAKVEDLIAAVNKLAKRLGGLLHQQCLKALSEGNYAEVARLTLDYYDKCYLHGLSKRDQENVFVVPSDTVDPAVNAKRVVDRLNELALPKSLAAAE